MTSPRRAAVCAAAAALVTTVCSAAPGAAAVAAPRDGADVTTVARLLDADGRPRFVEVERDTAEQERRAAAALPGSVGWAVDVPVSAAADPGRTYQWANDRLRLDVLPPVDTSTQLVAVLDTGVLADHEDFAPGQVRCDLGADFSGEAVRTNGCLDPHGHGTHVAGIVGAPKGNGLGIEGTAPGVPLLPVRVLNASGSGGAVGVADGIVWAVDHGATVINLSLAGPYSAAYDDAVAYAVSRDVAVVAAAGNNRTGGNAKQWPAASPGVTSVTATDSTGASAGFSNSNDTSDVAAPGSAIYSHDRTRTGYVHKSGTSMAAPVVAAAAALYRASHAGATEAATSQALRSSADDLEAPGFDVNTGWGLVDPYQLVTGEQLGPDVAPTRPGPPSAVPGDAVVDLSWTAVPSTPTARVAGYRVHRDGAVVASRATTTFRDTSVVNGTSYTYAVSAFGPGGESVPSSTVTVQPRRRPVRLPPAPAVTTPAPRALVATPVVPAGAGIPLSLSGYRAGSTVTVTEHHTVVRQVGGRTPVPVGARTVHVRRTALASAVVGRFEVGADGAASVTVQPLPGVGIATLVVAGVDAAGKAATTRVAIRVGGT